jgi:hypothetical protein
MGSRGVLHVYGGGEAALPWDSLASFVPVV